MNVPHFLIRSAIQFPSRPLWIDGEGTISFGEGRRRLDRVAISLLEVAKQYDRVAILTSNRFEGFEIYLAAMHAGMAAVPMNPRNHPREYAYTITDSSASVLVYSEEFASTVREIAQFATLPPNVYCIGDWQEGMPGRPYDELVQGEDLGAPKVNIDPDDVAWLFYTSGTTGQPKGAMETHRNLVQMVHHFLTGGLDDANENDVMLHLAPISHGTTSIGLVFLARGGAQAFPLSKSFDPEKVCEAIQKYRVTATMMAPTMVQMLVSSDAIKTHNLSSLKSIVYGGAPMHRAVLEDAMKKLGPVFIQSYGQGEAAACCAALNKQDHICGDDPVKIKRLSSVGREATGVIIRIVNEAGQELPTGEAGEIAIRSDLVMRGYWNKPEATAAAKVNGWLRTGDVGYLDDGGYLFLTDRVKDMIISGGSNIYPREIEEVLYTHPAIAEVAVIGLPDEKWGESVAAIVVLKAGANATQEELIGYTRQHIASYKKPKRVIFADALPKSSYGKVLKRELRDHYKAHVPTN
ncbi:long-chain-fatty-acid--CoA ligase [Rhizobium leguminosarum]|uniref:long-chain-fatty-acid--CoA ligase n=1 Tax=Rhizobium leguminosarum TaxID=384 RepID=UPI0024A8E573|nr:long-chain-fatty-acid--CoA ligase [Rhizobium leguminosarum]MDI5930005.1 long-chain-fatty-acid--CoA ligase [Rhizobium leguminosarum]